MPMLQRYIPSIRAFASWVTRFALTHCVIVAASAQHTTSSTQTASRHISTTVATNCPKLRAPHSSLHRQQHRAAHFCHLEFEPGSADPESTKAYVFARSIDYSTSSKRKGFLRSNCQCVRRLQLCQRTNRLYWITTRLPSISRRRCLLVPPP